LTLPRSCIEQKDFVRILRRAALDSQYAEKVCHFRDSVIRSGRRAGRAGEALTIALSGAEHHEGTSSLALLLALSLGASPHNRVAFLDGRLNVQRFNALSHVLSLSRNGVSLKKGVSQLGGYFNEAYPNVYFLKQTGEEKSLAFFSDEELAACFESLRKTFNYIVIDLPPLLGESCNLYVTPLADLFYLVVSAGKTRLANIDKCMEAAEEMEVDISGVVVNRQRLPRWSRFLWRDYFV